MTYQTVIIEFSMKCTLIFNIFDYYDYMYTYFTTFLTDVYVHCKGTTLACSPWIKKNTAPRLPLLCKWFATWQIQSADWHTCAKDVASSLDARAKLVVTTAPQIAAPKFPSMLQPGKEGDMRTRLGKSGMYYLISTHCTHLDNITRRQWWQMQKVSRCQR